MVYKLLVSKEVLLQKVSDFFGEDAVKSLRKWMKKSGEDKIKSPRAEEIIKNIHHGIIDTDMSAEHFSRQIIDMFKEVGGDSFKPEYVASAIDQADVLNENIEEKFTLGSSKTDIKGLQKKKERLSYEDLGEL